MALEKKPNVFRMAWHAVGGLVIFLTLYVTSPRKSPTIILLTFSLALLTAIDLSRLLSRRCDAKFWKYLGFLTSGKDKRIPNTSVLFLASILATVALFPPIISMAAIINLAVGDSVALFVGTHFGRLRIRNKSLEGAVASFAVCFTLLHFLLNGAILPFVGAFSGSAVELVSPDFIDDNISIPLASASAMWLAMRFLT